MKHRRRPAAATSSSNGRIGHLACWLGAVQMCNTFMMLDNYIKRYALSTGASLCLALTLVLPCGAQAPEPNGPKAGRGQAEAIETLRQEAVKKVGPQAYEIGNVHIDASAREVRFAAAVNMNEGLIEVVISTPEGKLHESILVASIRPLHLHVALLLVGLTPGSNPAWYLAPDPSMRPKGWERPAGSLVDVFVSWEAADGPREVRAEALLIDTRSGEVQPETSWVFVGSHLNPHGEYLADGQGSIMTNYHDMTAVLDNPLDSGRIDEYMHANSSLVPSPGTPVQVRMAPVRGNRKDTRHE